MLEIKNIERVHSVVFQFRSISEQLSKRQRLCFGMYLAIFRGSLLFEGLTVENVSRACLQAKNVGLLA